MTDKEFLRRLTTTCMEVPVSHFDAFAERQRGLNTVILYHSLFLPSEMERKAEIILG